MHRLILTSASILLTLAAQAQAPTPASVLGHTPGDDYYLANYEDSIRYFHELAAHSDRMKMFTVGKSTEGRDIEVAVISSPAEPGASGRVQSDCAETGYRARGWTTHRRCNWRAAPKSSSTSTAACTPAKSPAASTPLRWPTNWLPRRAIPRSTPSSTT